MTDVRVGVVDVFVVRPRAARDGAGSDRWRVLCLQRALDTRCPTAWETVHGTLEPNERPEDGALREVQEETGLVPERMYSIGVQPFYLHRFGVVQMAVVFCAFVAEPATVTLGPEHQAHRWLTVDEALATFAWPRERQGLREAVQLLEGGDAGAVEDVLRVV
jgi:8-oxo-dGTP pyrophosphatase MutT (NUDIX family)